MNTSNTKDKYKIEIPCPCHCLQFCLTAVPINRDQNGNYINNSINANQLTVRVRIHTKKQKKYLFCSPYTKIDRFFLSIFYPLRKCRRLKNALPFLVMLFFSYKAISLIFIPFHIVFLNFPWYNMEKEIQTGVNYGKYKNTRRSLRICKPRNLG